MGGVRPFSRGYPAIRKEPQQASRKKLEEISKAVHLPLDALIYAMPEDIVVSSLSYPGVLDVLDLKSMTDNSVKSAIQNFI